MEMAKILDIIVKFILCLYYLECDDGNTVSGDGCSEWCFVEKAYTCTGGSPNSPDACTETCGDCRRVHEACDDCNTLSGDGCSSTC